MMACILCFSWIRYEKWYVCASVCMCRYLCGVQMYMYGVSGVCMRDVFMQVCICVFIYICTGLSKALDDWCQAKGGLEESVAFSWQFLRVDLRKEGVKPWPNTVCMYVCICDSLSLSFICMCMYSSDITVASFSHITKCKLTHDTYQTGITYTIKCQCHHHICIRSP